jgi:hypothetical protein
MLTAKTLLILGAGSSIAYGYPSGRDLVAKIGTELPSDARRLIGEAEGHSDKVRDCRVFAEAVRNADPVSIDAFIARNSDQYGNTGLFAITYYMLKAEADAANVQYHATRPEDDDWRKFLFECLTEGNYEESLDSFVCPLSVLSFNYDRSFEYCFDTYMKANFSGAQPEHVEKHLDVKHVYGCVRQTEPLATYGNPYTYDEVTAQAMNLSIMYESREPMGRQVSGYDDWLKTFQRVFFLGFAYDDLNMVNIHVPEAINRMDAQVFGTVKGMPGKRTRDISRAFSIPPLAGEFLDCDCRTLLQKYF